MAAVAQAASLEEIAAEACPYPSHLLPRGGSGLCLFAAGFLGQNDAIHMQRAGMVATCVDTDEPRLMEMADIYGHRGKPLEWWQFCIGDAWEFAGQTTETFDVVSVDNYTGEIEPRVLASLPLWCSLGRRLVTVTIGRGQPTPEIPDGWRASRMHRSPIADWLVLQRG